LIPSSNFYETQLQYNCSLGTQDLPSSTLNWRKYLQRQLTTICWWIVVSCCSKPVNYMNIEHISVKCRSYLWFNFCIMKWLFKKQLVEWIWVYSSLICPFLIQPYIFSFCSPNSPTRAAATREQLVQLVRFTKDNGSIKVLPLSYIIIKR